jgi:hypothetical protein
LSIAWRARPNVAEIGVRFPAKLQPIYGLGAGHIMDIGRWFVITGAVLGTIGMVMGIAMGIGQDFTLAPAHAHLNLVGWVSLVLFGLAYRVEVAKSGTLATIHYWLALAGAIIFPVGIYFAVVRDQPAVAIVGALLTLISMLIFIINIWRAPRRAFV